MGAVLTSKIQHRRRAAPTYVLIVCIIFLFTYREAARPSASATLSDFAAQRRTARFVKAPSPATGGISAEITQFWEELLDAMTTSRPPVPPLHTESDAKGDEFDPERTDSDSFRRPSNIHLSDAEVEKLRDAHTDFVVMAKQLASSMPYKKGSRGIVMTASQSYVGIAITSLLLLRRTGCRLPVQLVLDTITDQDRKDCNDIIRSLDAECVNMEPLWQAMPSAVTLEKYQFKVLAMIFSSFQEMLFLDADCWPLKDPEPLFDNEPYLSHGLVTWQDHWFSTVSPLFYDITQADSSVGERRRTSESGVMLYNKADHATSLLLAAYYNYYGPDYYYHLLSQGGHGEGDKETFLHSALVTGASYYEVQTRAGFFGRWINGSFERVGMRQADPQLDYELSEAFRDILSEQQGSTEDSSARRKRIARARADDAVHAPWMFIHQIHAKIDIRRVGDIVETLQKRDAAYGLQRLWGDDVALREMVGYDPERVLWQAIIDADCHSTLLESCGQIRDWFSAVFH